MRLLLLNQYGPDSGAPTGRILSELGLGLQQLGHEVVFLEVDSTYGILRRGRLRIFHEVRSHIILFGRSLVCTKIDAVISLTSPACLAVTAGVISRLHRARHFHWAMDIYPDVGVRLGELKDGVLTRFLTRLMRRAYRQATKIVALDDDMREYLHDVYGVDSVVMEPFPPEVEWSATAQEPGEPKRWLYSGNFGRAHEIDVLLQVQQRLESRHVDAELVLQGHGAQLTSSQEAARQLNLHRVKWRPPATQQSLGQSLLQADVLVVTRKAAMKGLLLPSKLMLAELSGRTVLWIGDTDSQTARRLAKAGHGVFALEEVESIAAWLQQLFEKQPAPETAAPQATRTLREHSIRRWDALLRNPSP